MSFTSIASFAIATLIITAQTGSAQAVSSLCPPGSVDAFGQPDNARVAQDACQKAIDLFHYVAPELGAILAGGSATQAFTGSVGGIGHFSVGIRGNGMNGSLPDVDRVVPSASGAQQSTYTITGAALGLPTDPVNA